MNVPEIGLPSRLNSPEDGNTRSFAVNIKRCFSPGKRVTGFSQQIQQAQFIENHGRIAKAFFNCQIRFFQVPALEMSREFPHSIERRQPG